jgi:hypothetical protein
MKMKLRPYQSEIVKEAIAVINKSGFVYLAMEVRTGKTLTSLSICSELQDVANVLFITKKKAISSIESDVKLLSPLYNCFVINYESVHKAPDINWDVIIFDEAHSMGAFPKPSNRAIAAKHLVHKTNCKVIFLSGTPTPESYSQIYHQLFCLPNGPFSEYKNFYVFAKAGYVDIKQRKINGRYTNDYSHGNEVIMNEAGPYMIVFSQAEAGFKSKIEEHFLSVDIKDSTMAMIQRLKKDLVIEGKTEVILADTPVKLMSKVHQLCSGTIKFESGNSMVIDLSKAQFIQEFFKGKKIGIFYKFKEEFNGLKSVFDNTLTTEVADFDTGKYDAIALQIVSGREGISLRNADAIVYYNIDFSATSYWQSRDRMTTKDRLHNHVYWVFSKGGIEWKIYKAVSGKTDYTLSHFRRDFVEI